MDTHISNKGNAIVITTLFSNLVVLAPPSDSRVDQQTTNTDKPATNTTLYNTSSCLALLHHVSSFLLTHRTHPTSLHAGDTMLKRLVYQTGRVATRSVSEASCSSSSAAVSTTIINAGAQHKAKSIGLEGQQRRSMMMVSTRGGGMFRGAALSAHPSSCPSPSPQ